MLLTAARVEENRSHFAGNGACQRICYNSYNTASDESSEEVRDQVTVDQQQDLEEPEAEQVAETEVEAAPLVMSGPHLEWEWTSEKAWAGGLPGSWDFEYTVYGDDEVGWWTQYIHEGGVEDGPIYPSADVAKAACERRYATGKWD